MIALYKNIGMPRLDFFLFKFFFYLAILQVTLQASNHVKFTENEIIKSENDTRNYRGLILENDMKVLLISDPTTKESAVALSVKAGNMNNPPELQGLAYLCEYLLLRGSKNYPDPNNFPTYIDGYGGAWDAFLSSDNTNYHFDVHPEGLEGALDRLAESFFQPLFNESLMDSAIQFVDENFKKNIDNDATRWNYFDKFIANPKHPYSYSNNGNKENLETINKINIREDLLKFYNTWYSANNMALSVIGQESLDDLEEMVVKRFSKVANKNTEAPKWTEHPFNQTQFQHKWYIVPVKDVRTLIIVFPLPALDENILLTPVNYLTHLITNEGEGSLLSDLKQKNWSDLLYVFKTPNTPRGVNFFTFYIELTEEGLNHIDEIVTLIFLHIKMLKTEGLQKRIFDEYQSIQNMNFRFQKRDLPFNDAIFTADNLQKYPIKEVLRSPHVPTEWKPDLIENVLDYLIPENIRMLIIAKTFENITTEIEPRYKTQFKKEKISKNVIAKWNNVNFNPNFEISGIN